MTKKTHVAAGLVVTASVMMLAKEVNLACGLGIIGAIVPDWDMILGMKHRGISHSFIFAIGLGALLSVFSSIFALSFILNYCLHIVLDSLTVMGCPIFNPFDKTYYGIKIIKTGDEYDNFLFIFLVFCNINIIFKNIN